MRTGKFPGIASALLVVNETSGSGRGFDDILRLRREFHACFGSVASHIFETTQGHAEVTQVTRDFVCSHEGPHLLLSGGGGGTNRAVVQGLFDAAALNLVTIEHTQLSSLRLGSGNLVPKHFGLPKDPVVSLRGIAADLCAGQSQACCVYRCIFHYPDSSTTRHYGITLAGLGQFARVPGDIQRWKHRHARLLHHASRLISIEALNTLQYVAFSLARAARCIAQPGQAEQVEVRQADRVERFRLLAGMLLNFDFPQLPIRTGCGIGEARLALCCISHDNRRRTLGTLLNQETLNRRVLRYEIASATPLELVFLDNDHTIVALDEDTFAAPARIRFEVAGLLPFVTGTACYKVAQAENPSGILRASRAL